MTKSTDPDAIMFALFARSDRTTMLSGNSNMCQISSVPSKLWCVKPDGPVHWYKTGNSKTCLRRPLKKKTKIGFQDRLSLNAGKKYCRMLPLEHSAILSTSIKLPFVIKVFVLFIFERPLKTGYNVLEDVLHTSGYHSNSHDSLRVDHVDLCGKGSTGRHTRHRDLSLVNIVFFCSNK